MNNAYRNGVRDHGKTMVTHIGLVNGSGVEPSGGSPAYARLAVTWANDGDGVMRPNADLVFDIPAGFTVAGWRGFSGPSGGTDYGGQSVTSEAYTGQGTYRLRANLTSITHGA
jgi:hypothetical protein